MLIVVGKGTPSLDPGPSLPVLPDALPPCHGNQSTFGDPPHRAAPPSANIVSTFREVCPQLPEVVLPVMYVAMYAWVLVGGCIAGIAYVVASIIAAAANVRRMQVRGRRGALGPRQGTRFGLRASWQCGSLSAALPLLQRVLGDAPGPRALPVLGNVLELLVAPHRFFPALVALMERHAPAFAFWCGPACFVVTAHPLDYELVLTNPKFNDKSPWYPMLQAALGRGLIVLSGEPWRRHRKVVAPSMHQQVLAQHVQVGVTASRRMGGPVSATRARFR